MSQEALALWSIFIVCVALFGMICVVAERLGRLVRLNGMAVQYMCRPMHNVYGQSGGNVQAPSNLNQGQVNADVG